VYLPFGNFNVCRLWLGLALGLLLLVAVCVDECEAAKKKKAKKKAKPVDDAKSDDDDDADTEKSEGKKKAKADGKTDWKKMTKVASQKQTDPRVLFDCMRAYAPRGCKARRLGDNVHVVNDEGVAETCDRRTGIDWSKKRRAQGNRGSRPVLPMPPFASLRLPCARCRGAAVCERAAHALVCVRDMWAETGCLLWAFAASRCLTFLL
jgi:hypothetical protein